MLLRMLSRWWAARRRAAPAMSPAQALKLIGEGRLAEAEAGLRDACAIRSDDAASFQLYGYALTLSGKTAAAIEAWQRAVALEPANADALYNLANAQRSNGNVAAALELFTKVTQLQPAAHLAYVALADLHASVERFDDAEKFYLEALARAPDAAEAHYNYGNLLLRSARADDAIEHYRQAVSLQPQFVRAYSNLLCALNYGDSASREAIRDAHFDFDARYGKAVPRLEPVALTTAATDRLRIGYVSPDFRNHAVGRLIEPALKHHDRSRFMVHCYSDVRSPDERTARLRSYVDVWRDATALDDDALAAIIRNDRIDLLVDLTGHTDGNRLLVFARKPAPVQVTWIGYPNTTGLSAIDYRITDAYADPPGLTENLHSERLYRLPEMYLPCERPAESIDVGEPPSVQRGYVTFGSFNNAMKLSSTSIALWSRVLSAVPGSRLLAITLPPGRARARVLDAFERQGVAADRVELHGTVSHAEFLRKHHEVDIALDTYPYHGTTTTAHTLWMGVPVVTLAGDTHRSRAGVSFLSNAGCADLVAGAPDEYVAIAKALAGDAPRLQALRMSLRSTVERSAIMDGERFTRALETAFLAMARGAA